MLLCILNGKLEQFMEIEKLEKDGLAWIEADFRKALLVKGLPEKRLYEEFSRIIQPISRIKETIDLLKKNHIHCIVITAGPKQVAYAAEKQWGFDASYGSDFGIERGVFTGEITQHIGDQGKIGCLKDYCQKHGITGSACIAVGDGSTDIPLFEYCGKSIAINARAHVIEKATYALRTNDLSDILPFIL